MVSTSESFVETEFESGVLTVMLNRPERLNALTQQMKDELRHIMLHAASDDRVRVVVLTGAGRGFCAGADISFLDALAAGEPRPAGGRVVYELDARPAFLTEHSYFAAIPKPIIAAINGPVAGLGLILASYCDIRLASSVAFFSISYALRGLVAEYGSAWLLPRQIGVGATMDLMLTGRRIDAAEALRIGFVSAVHDAAVFRDRVFEYARDIAGKTSPRATARIKHQVYEAFFQQIDEAIELSEVELAEALGSEDFREGVAHYKEKRAPRFTGK